MPFCPPTPPQPEFAITEAYLAADRKLLSVGAGFMGMGERGVGGSKCGATAANVLLFPEQVGCGGCAVWRVKQDVRCAGWNEAHGVDWADGVDWGWANALLFTGRVGYGGCT